MKTWLRNPVFQIVLALHGFVDLALLLRPWYFQDEVLALLVGWTMSQNALVTLGAVRSGIRWYGRIAVAALGVIWTWLVAVTILPVSIFDGGAAGWGAAFALHGLIVLGVLALDHWLRSPVSDPDSTGSGTGRRKLQYGVGSLLLWSAIVAVPLGLIRTAAAHFGWSARTIDWRLFFAVTAIGGYNAVFTLVALAPLGCRQRRTLVSVLAAIVLCQLACFHYPLLYWWAGPVGVSFSSFLVLAGSQLLFLYATLLPIGVALRGRRMGG